MRHVMILGFCILGAACDGQWSGAPTAPSSSATLTTTQTQAETAGAPPVEVSFTKWAEPAPPDFVGVTGDDVVGTMTAKVLSSIPFDNGVIVQLEARYRVIDPYGNHSFTALIQGKQNTQTGTGMLNGVITEGWLIGAQVHVTFEVITPCAFGTRNRCFEGTIRIMPGSAG